jgi:predicted enzyme related to lactoylglutathione lyase
MKLNSIILFSNNPKQLLEFYKKVLNMEPDWTNGEYSDFKTGGAYFEIGPHSNVHGVNNNPERVLLNFHVKDVDVEYVRIKAAGAKVIKEPYQPEEDSRLTIATFADPDGNYFQIMTAWEDLI